MAAQATVQVELLLRELETEVTQPRGTVKMNLLDGSHHCSLESCNYGAKVVLGGSSYCLEHFIVRSYERLNQLDPGIRGKRGESKELLRLRESVEECSNRALLVSLRCESLTNHDRSRLLDILLWSSDLLFLLNISPRDFDLLAAFREDSESSAPGEYAPPQSPKTQSLHKPEISRNK